MEMEKRNLKTASSLEWLEQETAGCKFKDKRLGERFKNLLTQLWNGIGETVPFAC